MQESVAIATTKLLFGTCDCNIDSDVGTGNFSLVLGFWKCMVTHTCDHTCLQAWTEISDFMQKSCYQTYVFKSPKCVVSRERKILFLVFLFQFQSVFFIMTSLIWESKEDAPSWKNTFVHWCFVTPHVNS